MRKNKWKLGLGVLTVLATPIAVNTVAGTEAHAAQGWVQSGSSWYFYNNQGNVVRNAWQGNYWLGADGKMATNAWVDGGRYYVGSNGLWVKGAQKPAEVKKQGWVQNGSAWNYYYQGNIVRNAWVGSYWLGSDGRMATNTWVDGGRHYVGANGVWDKNAKKQEAPKPAEKKNGWLKEGSTWYYYNQGIMVRNAWQGNYWLGSDGKMATSSWVDNGRYYVGADGVWDKNAKKQEAPKPEEKKQGWKKEGNKEAGNVTDRWILHNLNETIGKATANFDKFEFGVAGHILYNFIWDEFADWYVELTKEVLYSDNEEEKVITRSVLLYTLDKILRLLHPIMPFVTEEIFGQISEGSIVTAAYPTVNPDFEDLAAHTGVESLKDLIRAVRNARAEVNVAPSKPITILVKTSDSDLEAFFNSNVNYIKRFTNPEHLEIASTIPAPELAMSSVITGAEIYLPLADLLNVEEELARLDKELAKWQKELDMVGKKLSNERFVANAKPEVVQKERDKQADYQAKYDATVARIDDMKKLVK